MSDRAITNDWKDGVLTDISEVNPSVSLFNLDPNATVTFLSMADVGENGRVLTPQTRLMQEVRNGFTRFVEGDVLFAKITPCMENGKGAFALNLANGHGFGSTEFHVLRANEFGDSEFIFHVTQNSVLRSKAESYFSGSAGQQRVSTDFFSKYSMLIPPLPQQKKIARILTTVDNLIEKTEALIEKYKAIKQGMMHDLFTRGVDHNGKLRPHYEEAPHLYKESPLGWIPKEWEVDKFKNLTSVLTCGLASTPTYVDETEGVAFLSAQNVSKGRMSYHKFSHIPLQLHRSITKYNKPQRGDILYIRVGNNMGEAANVDVDWDFSIYVSLTLIRMNDSCSNVFYKHLLNSIEYKRLSKRDVFVGGGVGNLNVNIVREFDMLVPSLPEQDEIAQRLDSSDEFMRREEATLSKYQLLKTGLMQDLLTGNVRVKVDEVEEELANA